MLRSFCTRQLLCANTLRPAHPVSSRLLVSSSDSDTEHFDVIISGGGLIGGAMACALGTSEYFENKKVLLLEAEPPPQEKHFDPSQAYSQRVCAISPGSKKLMEKLQVWDGIHRKCPVKKMQVWDACSSSIITFHKDDLATDLCYIIENDLMTSSFYNRISQIGPERLQTKFGAKIKSCRIPKNYAQEEPNLPIPNVAVQLEDGKNLECDLLIAADGARSFVAQQAHITKISWEYDQMAIVATLKLSEVTENIVAWQRFLPTGPIAMLPLDSEHSSLVWSATPEMAEELLELSEHEFIGRLNDAFWTEYEKKQIVSQAESIFQGILDAAVPSHDRECMQLPPAVSCVQGKRAKFPLGLSHSNTYVKPRLALVGDSAHRVHPLAGQGANLGFGDIECLSQILERAVHEGKDIGCLLHLLKYEKERQLQNAAVTAVTDSLNKLYSTDSLPAVLLRSVGLMGTNASKALKDLIINQATK